MKRHVIELKSTSENINQVEKFVDEICDEYNINNSYFGNILIPLTEAFYNAVIHGNKNSPDKTVKISFQTKPSGMTFTVADKGKGFDFNNIPDPTDLNINETNTGRGIYLIKSLADDVHFNNNGNKIEMSFHVASINKELAIDRINKLNAYYQKIKQEVISKKNSD